MTDDRELIELAAKAVGIIDEIEWFEEPYGNCFVKDSKKWNPLTDDGDAMRLAVKLNILTYQTGGDASYASTPMNVVFTEQHNGDPYAATRRAIVRAAAEIGRSMK